MITSSFEPELLGGLLDEDAALPRRVEVERVDVEGVGPSRHQHVDLQQFVAQVLREAADALAPVAEPEDDLVPVISTGMSMVEGSRLGECTGRSRLSG